MHNMRSEYTAVIKQDGKWWIGWVEEIPGVNCQEPTQQELTDSLEEALREALALNCEDARKAAGDGFSEIKLAV
jgi:predicted RNase H-like HicB family nuclease